MIAIGNFFGAKFSSGLLYICVCVGVWVYACVCVCVHGVAGAVAELAESDGSETEVGGRKSEVRGDEPDAYSQTVADLFIRLRGRSLCLSPMDIDLIQRWKGDGVPLHVAVNAIEEVMGNHRGRRVRSLSYCSEEVAARFAELLERHAGCGGCDKPYCARRAA